MKLTHFILCLLLCGGLTQCAKDAPPPAGTLMAEDPVASALFLEAKNLRDSGKRGKAIDKLEELVEEHPLAVEAPESYLTIGDMQLEEGEPVRAFEAYDKMLKNYQNSSLYSSGIKRLEDLAFNVADGNTKYHLLGLFETSVSTSSTLEMLNSVRDNAPYASGAARAQLKIGEVYERVGMNDKAVEAYHKLVDDYPNTSYAPLAQYAVGKNHLNRVEEGSHNSSHLKSAQEAYEDFLQRYPKNKLASQAKEDLGIVRYKLAAMNLEIGRYYLKSNNRESAIFYFQEAAHNQYNSEVRNEALNELKELGVTPQAPKKLKKPTLG